MGFLALCHCGGNVVVERFVTSAPGAGGADSGNQAEMAANSSTGASQATSSSIVSTAAVTVAGAGAGTMAGGTGGTGRPSGVGGAEAGGADGGSPTGSGGGSPTGSGGMGAGVGSVNGPSAGTGGAGGLGGFGGGGGVGAGGAGGSLSCMSDPDCASNACDAFSGKCVANHCVDHHKDGDETDFDCGGGICPGCLFTEQCQLDRDCTSQACDAISHQCTFDPCSDHQQDGAETDGDCGGGTCSLCGMDAACKLDDDCASIGCDAISHTCVPQCADHQQDGDETDVDCGGGSCPGCPFSAPCVSDSDCTSQACDGEFFLCVADSCKDHRQDNGETDVDCGGADMCARCDVGKKCVTTTDCVAGRTCQAGNPHICI